MNPRELILNARKSVESKDWENAEKFYSKAIKILEKRKNISNDSKSAFFSAKAEHLSNIPYVPEKESFEDFKNRILDAIRYLNLCYNSISTESDNCFSNMYDIISKFIKTYGCQIPETEDHIIVSCPIQLNSDKFGSMGTSIGAYYDKALCSICQLDILDEKCIHVLNQFYEGKQCVPIYQNYQPVHMALVERPKDSRSRISAIAYPKEMFLTKSGTDTSKINLEEKLHVHCTRCKEEKIDPILINHELFFDMQGMNISFDKEPRKKFDKTKMKKGRVYFSSSMSLDYKPI